MRLERNFLRKKVHRLEKVIANLERRRVCLSYNDLRSDGHLGGSKKHSTFFPDFYYNDAFLDVVNYTGGCEPGEGLCENIVCFHHVSVDQRREHQENSDAADSKTDGNGSDGMSVDNTAGVGLASITTEASSNSRCGPTREMDSKTKWLVYCFYARYNVSMRRISALFDVSQTLISMLLDTEVSEMVFTEDWPAKMLVRHLETIGSILS